MPPSLMIKSVLQATSLMCADTLMHRYLLDDIWKDTGDKLMDSINNATNATYHIQSALNAGIIGNLTDSVFNSSHSDSGWHRIDINDTTVDVSYRRSNMTHSEKLRTPRKAPPSFFFSTFPREIILYLICLAFEYHWQILLERLLPARRVNVTTTVRHEKRDSLAEDDEAREAEIMERLIAKGKVRRSSLNWCNTFAKWLLDLVLGNLWMKALYSGLTMLLWSEKRTGNFKEDLLVTYLTSFFGMMPLASLVGFILVPAPKRIVFMCAAVLVERIFLAVAISVVMPWFFGLDFMQKALQTAPVNVNYHGEI